MKLAILLAALLASPSLAGAEILHPPSGPVEVDDDVDMQTADNSPADVEADVTPVNRGQGRMGMGDRRGGMGDPARRAKRQALRAALMAEFDANGDGRLGPRERQRAIRVLRRLERRLAGGPRAGGPAAGERDHRAARDPRAQRAQRMRRFIERYDTNGDGNVGPREVPRGAADRLRRFDRNGDGWVEPGEFGPRGR